MRAPFLMILLLVSGTAFAKGFDGLPAAEAACFQSVSAASDNDAVFELFERDMNEAERLNLMIQMIEGLVEGYDWKLEQLRAVIYPPISPLEKMESIARTRSEIQSAICKCNELKREELVRPLDHAIDELNKRRNNKFDLKTCPAPLVS